MRGKDRDAIGREQPPEFVRKRRAVYAARHRWKQKWQLVPGYPLLWGERSLANKERHLAATKKGGETTGRHIKEQQRLFWRWYYGDCKEQLRGAFKAVVETFERIEGAHVQRYGRRGSKALAWDGFEADVFVSYILRSCSKLKPELIEQKMWDRYKVFMEADDKALHEG